MARYRISFQRILGGVVLILVGTTLTSWPYAILRSFDSAMERIKGRPTSGELNEETRALRKKYFIEKRKPLTEFHGRFPHSDLWKDFPDWIMRYGEETAAERARNELLSYPVVKSVEREGHRTIVLRVWYHGFPMQTFSFPVSSDPIVQHLRNRAFLLRVSGLVLIAAAIVWIRREWDP